ncbi:ATP-binding cassette sub-family C member 4 isoform X1 [Leptinotarsa decemlineata]|uniref:ATP-binding cassette sub-family C member 4 isoform X1 n=1 Tax=Leptinotarsa decemlineata TaxID=7539 RepID=UPI003D305A3F
MEDGRLYVNERNEELNRKITHYVSGPDDYDFDENEEHHHLQADESTGLLESDVEIYSRNIHHEEKQLGEVKLSVYMRYYKFSQGPYMLPLLVMCYVAFSVSTYYTEDFLNKWVDMEPNVTDIVRYKNTNSSDLSSLLEDRNYYLNFYWVLIVTVVVLIFVRTYLTLFYSLSASIILHKHLSRSILNSFMTFFDSHYLGNIINRFSKDLSTLDETIPAVIHDLLKSNVEMIGLIILVSCTNPILLIPTGVLMLVLRMIQKFYLIAGRSIKRLESSTRSPMIGHLNATLEGLLSVRAFENHSLLIEEFDEHLDHFTSASYLMNALMKALSLYGALICSVFNAVVILKLVIFNADTAAGDVGLVILQASHLSSVLLSWIRQFADFESYMTATERVLEYIDIPTENRKSGQIRENWPKNGNIEFRNVSLINSFTKQPLSKNLSCVIQSKERIGIVGRTGVGRSSILSSLFRLYNINGSIIIDGVDIKGLSLEFLRSRMTIIPHDSILFPGTLRSNLDPDRIFLDEAIWNALEAVNMKPLIQDLQTEINRKEYISCAQKHLICLARALLRKNKIIVLDEPTANLDSATCKLLQSTMRKRFCESTVLIVTHRMDMVLDADRVMVIDHEGIVEFDPPSTLLRNENGVFYGMVQQAGLLSNQNDGF